MTEKNTEREASERREASECGDLLSSAADYIDAIERRLSADFNNRWNPSSAEIIRKRAAWLANKSFFELKGR